MSENKTAVKVLPCSCVHAFQDEQYGTGNRVHNWSRKPEPGGYRCTVCERKK